MNKIFEPTENKVLFANLNYRNMHLKHDLMAEPSAQNIQWRSHWIAG
jgi:hypothetical protein